MIRREPFEKEFDGVHEALHNRDEDVVGGMVDWLEQYFRNKGVELFEEKQVLSSRVELGLIEYYKRWKL